MKEISLHIMDLAQNSIAAGADRVTISLTRDSVRDIMTVDIADNGRGMPPDVVRQITDPFYTTRTTRKVGLGIPLFALTAHQCGGGLTVESAVGEGTRVTATLKLGHIDRPPVGDMATTVACLLAANPTLDLEYRHSCDGKEFSVTAAELRRTLDGVSLASPVLFGPVRDYIESGLRATGATDDITQLRPT